MNFFAALDSHSLALLPFSDSAFLVSAFSGITHLGDIRVIIVVALALALVLWRHGRHEYWIGLFVAVFGAAASSSLLKVLVARPRPLHALIEVSGYSLPSIHTATAVALYGYLIFVTLRLMHPPHHRTPVALALLTLIVLISASRVYLGVHYPTDVLAGIPIGALWIYAGYRAVKSVSPAQGTSRAR